MTTVDDILQLIEPSDRLRIVKDGKDLFVGYVGAYKAGFRKCSCKIPSEAAK